MTGAIGIRLALAGEKAAIVPRADGDTELDGCISKIRMTLGTAFAADSIPASGPSRM